MTSRSPQPGEFLAQGGHCFGVERLPETPSTSETWLTRARGVIVSGVVVAVTILVSTVIILEIDEGTYLIEPISVPEGFQKDVQDKEGVAARIRDAIGELSKEARDGVAIRPVVRDMNEPVVTLTGTTFSLRDVATLIREHFGNPYPIITGELSVLKPKAGDSGTAATQSDRTATGEQDVGLTLRLNGGTGGPFFHGHGDYASVVKKAAVATLRRIDPFTAASALANAGETDRLQALAWIQEAIGGLDAKDPSIPRAKLAHANVLLASKRFDEALAKFSEANLAYQRSNDNQEWYVAYDGIATARLLLAEDAWTREGEQPDALRNLEAAQLAVTKSLELAKTQSGTGDYDSALFHAAQIDDARATHWFAAGYGGECYGFEPLKEAIRGYAELTRRYPGFAAAYGNEATLYMKELKWFRTTRTPACGVQPANLKALEKDRVAKIRSLFDEAIAHDEHLAAPWLQGGIFLVEEQVKDLPLVDVDPRDRRALLDLAIPKLRWATSLLEQDPYAWLRLADALRDRRELTHGDAGAFGNEEGEAFCKAAALHRNRAAVGSIATPEEVDSDELQALAVTKERDEAGITAKCGGMTPLSAKLE